MCPLFLDQDISRQLGVTRGTVVVASQDVCVTVLLYTCWDGLR